MASSIYSSQYVAEAAFRYELAAPGNRHWASSGAQPFPHKIWFRFEKRVVLAKIGFSAKVEGPSSAPRRFQVIGAQECHGANVTWRSLLHVRDAGFQAGDEAKAWIIPRKRRRPLRCLGLKIYAKKVRGHTSLVTVQNMLMWEERVWYSDDPC